MLNELANELSAVLVEKDKSHILEGKDFSLEIHGVGKSKWNYPKFTEDAEKVRVTCAPLSMQDGRELNAPNSLTYAVKCGPKAIANNVRKLLVQLPNSNVSMLKSFLCRICSGQLNPDTLLGRFSASAGGTPSLC